ncbi:MAG TPA: hypothetical protein VED16_01950 [Candidatus Acidoferrum sp.]|nr:hypothetical protein [Candidatus Acidoferrum sp.]
MILQKLPKNLFIIPFTKVAMGLSKLLLPLLIAISLVLACSGCTGKIENVTLNKAHSTGETRGNLPSYPTAVRTFYMNDRIVGLLMTYRTNDSAKRVINFYKNEMQTNGYNMTRSFINSDETGGLIVFTKDHDRVYITVGQDSIHGDTNFAIKAKYRS